jgi:methyl-accepting chemotaxis protein
MALALATEVAYNPQAQALFAARERQQLLELVQISYESLREAFDVSQFQFHLAPATSFLRVNQPTQYGDDLSSFRPMVTAANATRLPVSGLEVGRSGLGLRGVVPMFHQGYPIGTVEVGLEVGAAWLAELKGELGGECRSS